MRPEPGAQAAAAGLRASTADRERVIDLLKAAFVESRLTRDEFGARVGQALDSRTYAELASACAGIPAALGPVEPAGTGPPQRPARAHGRPRGRVPMNTAITGGALVILMANAGMLAALLVGSGMAALLVAALAVIGAVVAITAMIVAP